MKDNWFLLGDIHGDAAPIEYFYYQNRDRLSLVEEEKSVELVISHTCPITYEPRDLFLSTIDQSQIDKSMELYLGEIETTLNYRRWAFGHFHADRLYPWDGEKEMLLLFNENVVDLKKYMEMSKSDYLDDILA